MGDTGQIGKKALPQRSTRGKRMKAQLAEEEEQADAEFWNQEFFAEDARDEDYQSEKEEEDVPDSDFFESESEDDDEEVEVRKEPKKKALKAPGAPPARPKTAKPPKTLAKKSEAGSPSALAAQQAAAAASGEVSQQLLFEVTYEAPTLRKSTRERMEVAQKEREERDQMAKATRRPTQKSEYRVLTQEELLAEAARTELENLASLKVLLAQEEETKRKANIKKQRYGGPMVKQRSRGIEVLLPPEPSTALSLEQLAAAGTSAAAAAAAPIVHWSPGVLGEAAPLLPGAAVAMDIDRAGQQQGAPAAAAAVAATAVGDNSAVASASAVKAEADPVAAPLPVTAETAVQAPADTAAAAAAAPPSSAAAAGPASAAAEIEAAPEPPAATPAATAPLEPQQQQQQQPTGPTLVKQEVTTLQCFGMKAPKWLQPQRVRPPPGKPLCAITGLVAKYKDPLTGHYYASAEAFRELRRRLGQPLPDAHKRRKSADAAAAAAGVSLGLLQSGQQGEASAAGAGGFPPGEGLLLSLLQQHVQQQHVLAASGRSRGGKAAYQPQPGVPDEVAALVLNVSQLVHGSS